MNINRGKMLFRDWERHAARRKFANAVYFIVVYAAMMAIAMSLVKF